MIKHKKNKNKKKEAKHSSLIVRWVSIVSLTIMVSFLIFSIAIYSTVSRQSINQQRILSNRTVDVLNSTLRTIPDEFQESNVVPALSLDAKRVTNYDHDMHKEKGLEDTFSNQIISSISNPDINAAIYNLHNKMVFSIGKRAPKLDKISASQNWKIIQDSRHHSILKTVRQVKSSKTDKPIGYIVVTNNMIGYNRLMNNLLHQMIVISIIAIVIFILIAYLVVRDVVRPIKEMSKVADIVDEDPNSEVRIKPLDRHDEVEDMIVSFNKMLDRMQRYIEQQKQFVSDVSHELRTPVAVIEGHLNMLERWGKDDPQILDESINASLQEADRMKHLIQEMLDLTRAEQIDVQYPNAVTDVNGVLSRVVNDMAMVHPDFNILLDVDDLPANTDIQMYQGHFEQVLVILIDNGIKYSTTRKQINVSAGVTHDELHIVVQDFGEGISEENQKKIFNRFYRVDKARTREKGGNGLGLSIAQKLISSYNGEISVESVEGQGSQFKIKLPVLSHERAAKLKELNAKKRDESNKTKGIL